MDDRLPSSPGPSALKAALGPSALGETLGVSEEWMATFLRTHAARARPDRALAILLAFGWGGQGGTLEVGTSLPPHDPHAAQPPDRPGRSGNLGSDPGLRPSAHG